MCKNVYNIQSRSNIVSSPIMLATCRDPQVNLNMLVKPSEVYENLNMNSAFILDTV